MNEYEVIGIVLVVGIGVITGLVKLTQPFITLNKSITELTMAIKELFRDNKEHHKRLDEHDEKLENHEKRIYLLEYKDGEKHEHD